jgi:hypothetical protein
MPEFTVVFGPGTIPLPTGPLLPRPPTRGATEPTRFVLVSESDEATPVIMPVPIGGAPPLTITLPAAGSGWPPPLTITFWARAALPRLSTNGSEQYFANLFFMFVLRLSC